MEEKLKQMFPEGQWGTGQKAWMVKDGAYFWAAAEVVDGEVVVTELGHKLLGTKPVAAKVEKVAEVEIPEFSAPKQTKKTGLK